MVVGAGLSRYARTSDAGSCIKCRLSCESERSPGLPCATELPVKVRFVLISTIFIQ
jgi:hypothetical protein